jgi:ribonuclease HI
MTTYLARWMRTGFRTTTKPAKPFSANDQAGKASRGQPIKNADLVKHLLVLLRRRHFKAGVRFKYVAGHVGWEGNEAADVSRIEGYG